MRKALIAGSILVLSFAPTGALAEVETLTSAAVEIVQRDLVRQLPLRNVQAGYFFQDVGGFVPNTGGFLNPTSGSVVGVELDYEQRLNRDSHWYLHAGGAYGAGGRRREIDNTASIQVFKDNFSSTYGKAGFGYVHALTRKASIYTEGGLFLSSTRLKANNGTIEATGPAYKVTGLEKSLGGRYQFNEKLGVYGGLYSQFGFASGQSGRNEHRETVKYGCYKGGLTFGL